MDRESANEIFSLEIEQKRLEYKKLDIQHRLGLETWEEVLTEMMRFKMKDQGVLS